MLYFRNAYLFNISLRSCTRCSARKQEQRTKWNMTYNAKQHNSWLTYLNKNIILRYFVLRIDCTYLIYYSTMDTIIIINIQWKFKWIESNWSVQYCKICSTFFTDNRIASRNRIILHTIRIPEKKKKRKRQKW